MSPPRTQESPDHAVLALPDVLRAIRRYRRLSQRELAARAGLPKSTIGRLESDRPADPSLSTVQRALAGAGYRIAIVDDEADEITALNGPGSERDGAGRHLPAHLERRRLTPRTSWRGWGRIAWEFTNDPRPANVYYLRVDGESDPVECA
jgi:transcriptional regulator with XRE-family HTH domain